MGVYDCSSSSSSTVGYCALVKMIFVCGHFVLVGHPLFRTDRTGGAHMRFARTDENLLVSALVLFPGYPALDPNFGVLCARSAQIFFAAAQYVDVWRSF